MMENRELKKLQNLNQKLTEENQKLQEQNKKLFDQLLESFSKEKTFKVEFECVRGLPDFEIQRLAAIALGSEIAEECVKHTTFIESEVPDLGCSRIEASIKIKF